MLSFQLFFPLSFQLLFPLSFRCRRNLFIHCYSIYSFTLSFRLFTPVVIPTQEESIYSSSLHLFLFVIPIIYHHCHSDFPLSLSFRPQEESVYSSSLSFRCRRNLKSVIYRIPITEPIHSIHFQRHQYFY